MDYISNDLVDILMAMCSNAEIAVNVSKYFIFIVKISVTNAISGELDPKIRLLNPLRYLFICPL